jgi:peptidoglycan/LPS O-acetylase OafA/YrhL
MLKNMRISSGASSAAVFGDDGLLLSSRSAATGHQATGYVPEVDALRAMAMSAVIAFHCRLMPFGWMGVWLFFVVSGFAVTTSLLAAETRGGSLTAMMKSFYLRRTFRIWPIYMLFVACNVLVLLALGKFGPLEDLPWLLSFTSNIHMIFKTYTVENSWPAFGHLWTVAIEQQFYVVFPFLILIPTRRARGLFLMGVVIFAPLLRAVLAHQAALLGWDGERIAFMVYAFGPAHFDAFAMGSLIALYRAEISVDRRISVAVMIFAMVCTTGYIAAYLTIGVLQSHHLTVDVMRNIVSGILYGQGREITVYLTPTFVSAAVLTGILSGSKTCRRICGIRSLQAIGRISYGGYLFHLPVLMADGLLLASLPSANVWPPIGPKIILFATAYPVTVGLAWLSFTYFERPFASLYRSASRASVRS